jgi:hypothetical protein
MKLSKVVGKAFVVTAVVGLVVYVTGMALRTAQILHAVYKARASSRQ